MDSRVSILLLAASVCLAASFPFSAGAQNLAGGGNPSVYVDAEKYNSFEDQSAKLEGHVKIIRGDETLTCDSAYINPSKNEVSAEGNVLLITPKDFIRAQKMLYNFSTKKGVVYNGFIQTGQETIEGAEIYKMGDSNYSAKDATYTSCINCPPSWKLSGSKIDASVGSYAYITNPVIRVYGTPVLWLPYIVIPIKTERQTGLLAPTFGNGSTDGFTIGDSYFWALSKSTDATLSETHYEKRGWKTGLEYRFVSDKNSSGIFQGNYISDNEFGRDTHYTAPDARVPTRDPVDAVSRYALHYSHHFELPENFVNNANINLVRDSTYTLDFPREMPGAGDPALENRVSVAKNSENTHSSIDVDVYQNLLKLDPIGDNEDAIHRVPELRYSAMPYHLFDSNLQAGLDIDYVNFARATSTYDSLSGSPTFKFAVYDGSNNLISVGDRFRTGQRIIIQPSLYYPFRVGDYLDVLPEMDLDYYFYDFGYSSLPTATRRFIRTSIDVKSHISSVFGNNDTPDSHRYKHEIRPEVMYTYVPYLYQDAHPFLLGPLAYGNAFNGQYAQSFRPGQPVTEFDNLQFDYRDRLTDLNIVTFGFTNLLTQKRVHGNSSDYRQIVRHTLTQSYDYYSAGGPDYDPHQTWINKFPWSEIHSLLEVTLDHVGFTSDLYYYPYQNAAAHATAVTLRDDRGDAISLGYSQSFAADIYPDTGLIRTPINIPTATQAATLSTYFSTTYLDVGASTAYTFVPQALPNGQTTQQGGFTSYSVNALFKPPGKCWGLGLIIDKTIGGPLSYNIALPIFFGGGKTFSVGRPPGI